MLQNFLSPQRDQPFLLPVDMREWLPEDDLAFIVLERSSRVIEKRCGRDVADRLIAGGLCPDHATIARFLARHETALGGLFSQVLRLLAAKGMVSLGLCATGWLIHPGPQPA